MAWQQTEKRSEAVLITSEKLRYVHHDVIGYWAPPYDLNDSMPSLVS